MLLSTGRIIECPLQTAHSVRMMEVVMTNKMSNGSMAPLVETGQYNLVAVVKM